MKKTDAPTYWQEFIPKSWSVFRGRYSLSFFKNDLIAGLTIGIISLPLAMAFAIASGVDPERGIFTSIIAGFLISLLGGSRLQIGGPTGAFVVIVYGVIQRFGYDGLVVATLMAGAILLIAAFSQVGKLIKYIPYPLVTGFTAGIAVILFSSQVKDFFGLQIENLPADFFPKWCAIILAFPTIHLPTLLMSLGLLFLIIFIRRFFPVIPWAIVAVVVGTLVSYGFNLPLDTISSRFGEIPRVIPVPSLPNFSGTFANLHELIPDAITIAFLAGIESLLAAIVADGMAGTRHKSNCELFGQGIANMSSVIFGGIPATGAIARTAMNIKAGAKTPVSGMIHALTVFLIVFAFAPMVSQIPIAALSAILMMVAWNMSEYHHFRHLFKAPKSDVIVLLTTFILTVVVDLTVAVQVGLILSLFLFMKKIAMISEVGKSLKKNDVEPLDRKTLPPHVEIYEITGPLFFGVADSLKNVLANLEYPPKVFILRMDKVPFIDASGMHALTEFYNKCQKRDTLLFLTEVKKPVHDTLKKYGLTTLVGERRIFDNLDAALKKAESISKEA